jgi:tetratricopeptide (TPR) repeat protein
MFVTAFPFLVFMQAAQAMANSQALSGGSNDGALPEPGMAARTRRLRIFASAATFAGLFAGTLLVSWQLQIHFLGDEEQAATQPDLKKKPPLKKIETAGTALQALERGDQALAQYRFGEALAHFEELLVRDPHCAALVDYRVGLCNESLGALERAQEAYRKAIVSASNPAMNFAAHLGIARCLLRGDHPADARRLLYPFVHDEARQVSMPPTLLAGARSIIALAFAREANPPAPASPYDDVPVAFLCTALDAPYYLDEIAPSASRDAEPVVETIVPPLRVRKREGTREAIVERVELDEPSAWKLLDRLAEEAGLRTAWSEQAKKSIADRPLRLSVRNWPLVELLEQAADRFGLLCRIDGETVSFATLGEADANKASIARMDTARRALLAALAADEAHPWAPAVCLELGNMEAAHGRSKKAAIWFDRLLRKAPSSSFAAPACYNLALAQLGDQEFTLARQTFFRVIDQAPGHELALRAYARIGRSYLEEGNTEEAIRELRRAASLAPKSAWQGVNALLLTAAHLRCDDWPGARQVLNKHRKTLQKEPCKSMAAFLDAYGQYRLAKPLNGGRREAGELLDTLGADLDDRLLGPVGWCIAAQAFQDLGFADQAERLLRKTVAKSRGPVVSSLEHLLAESLLAQNRQDEAIPLLEKLAKSETPARPNARFRLAQIDLQKKRYSDCVVKCKELWSQGAFAEPAALLSLWGAALEKTGDFANAARCFAGKAPE